MNFETIKQRLQSKHPKMKSDPDAKLFFCAVKVLMDELKTAFEGRMTVDLCDHIQSMSLAMNTETFKKNLKIQIRKDKLDEFLIDEFVKSISGILLSDKKGLAYLIHSIQMEEIRNGNLKP